MPTRTHYILYAIIIILFLWLHFLRAVCMSSSLPFLPSTGFYLPASFSILSPRIIFTSVINKSALWTFLRIVLLLLQHDDANTYCWMRAQKCHEGVLFFVLAVDLCAAASAAAAAVAVPVSPGTWENWWDWNPFGNRTLQKYLNTYNDDCLDSAAIKLLWHWLLLHPFHCVFVSLSVCDDAHKSALRQWKFTVLKSERHKCQCTHIHEIPIGKYHTIPINGNWSHKHARTHTISAKATKCTFV